MIAYQYSDYPSALKIKLTFWKYPFIHQNYSITTQNSSRILALRLFQFFVRSIFILSQLLPFLLFQSLTLQFF